MISFFCFFCEREKTQLFFFMVIYNTIKENFVDLKNKKNLPSTVLSSHEFDTVIEIISFRMHEQEEQCRTSSIHEVDSEIRTKSYAREVLC